MISRLLFSIYLLILSNITLAQNNINLDSLEKKLTVVTENEKLEILNKISKEYSSTNFNKSVQFAEQLISLATKHKSEKYLSLANSNIGDAYYFASDFDNALQFYKKSNELAKKIEDNELISNSLNNIGILYYLWGELEVASNYFTQSLEICKKTNDHEGEANCLNNLGNIQLSQGNTEKANSMYLKALEIKKKTENLKDYANGLINIGNTFENIGNYETALSNYSEALKISKQVNEYSIAAQACQNIGLVYKTRNQNSLSFDYLDSALIYNNKISNKLGTSEILNNIGLLYYDNGEFTKSLEFYQKALKIQEELKNKSGLAVSYFNIGNIYKETDDYIRAREYLNMSLEIKKELNDEASIANIYNSIGIICSNTQAYEEAIDYFYKAIEINKKLKNDNGLAQNLENLGTLMEESGKPHDAINFYEESLKLEQSLKNSQGIAKSLLNLGRIYKDLNEYEKALSYFKRCESIAKTNQFRKLLMQTYKQISEIFNLMYINTKNVKSLETSHDYYIEYSKLKDTIYNEEKTKQLSEIQTKIETLKKDKELELLKKDKKIAKTEKDKQQLFIYFLIFGIVVIVGLLLLIYNRYLVKNKANNLLSKQNREILEQKNLIERQRKDILDSISSAQRIQQAILPQSDYINEIFDDSCFIFYQPRDIVSGDFYWLNQQSNLLTIAAADCTGHGVPGAFMSMLGISLLNEVINIQEVSRPDEILNYMREKIIKALHQKEENDVKEGMDMSLIRLDKSNLTLDFSGAYNSLLIVRKGEIMEIKADKMPVSIYYQMPTFNNTRLQLEKGDMLYLSSDGYADQLGGEALKKFMKKRFKDLLIEIHSKPIDEQKNVIEQTFNTWKGSNEQIDDILVIGIRIN